MLAPAALAATTADTNHTETTSEQTGIQTGADSHEEADGEHNSAAGEHAADPGVIGLFGLNWKLFLAQLANFGIILFVLWKWVFGPVTKTLSERTAKIEASLSEAKRIAEDRETFDTWKNGEIAKVRQEAAAIITQAKADAEQLKISTLAQTKEDQNKIIVHARAQMDAEKNAVMQEAKAEIAEMVVTATESILRQKIDSKKDAELIKAALKEAGA